MSKPLDPAEHILLDSYKRQLQKLLPTCKALQVAQWKVLLSHFALPIRGVLFYAMPTFFRGLPRGTICLALHYQGEALICHHSYWQDLERLCHLAFLYTGCTEVHVRGSDIYIRCWLDFASHKWVRESVGGAK